MGISGVEGMGDGYLWVCVWREWEMGISGGVEGMGDGYLGGAEGMGRQIFPRLPC